MVGPDDHEDHLHSEDRHVHGEPWRVLDGDPFPATAVLYGAGGEAISRRDRDYWHERLVGSGFVERLFGAGVAPSGEEAPSPSGVEFASPDYEGLDGRLRGGPVLFVPVTLRTGAGVWEDLAANDVTVSWVAVDPDRDAPDRPFVAVLSDWVVQVGGGLPAARSAGIAPGLFHVTADHLEAFDRAARSAEGFPAVLNRFLEGDGVKMRPGFLHEGEWERVRSGSSGQ